MPLFVYSMTQMGSLTDQYAKSSPPNACVLIQHEVDTNVDFSFHALYNGKCIGIRGGSGDFVDSDAS